MEHATLLIVDVGGGALEGSVFVLLLMCVLFSNVTFLFSSRLASRTIPGRKSFTGKGFKTCSRDNVLMFLERILE